MPFSVSSNGTVKKVGCSKFSSPMEPTVASGHPDIGDEPSPPNTWASLHARTTHLVPTGKGSIIWY
eukprot:scaffold175_cov414-Prasinococcus_capsulatus_cf.AAC.24